MSEIGWIKIRTDMFDHRKIKQIETLPDGDSIIVIWVKLLCLAGATNNGGLIYLTRDIPYTEEMLANEFRRPLNTVRLALQTFEQLGMIEKYESIYAIANWEKYQSIEGMDKVREQTRERVRNYRERQKALSNVTVTQGNAIDKDTETEKEKENKLYSAEICEIINYFNQVTHQKRTVKNKQTNERITARLKDGFSVDDFKKVIDNKWAEWRGTEYEKYMRPETLFAPSHFEAYLNQKVNSKGKEIWAF